MFLFIFERGGGAERERETQNLKQVPGSELSVQSKHSAGLEPTNQEIMALAEVGGLTD